MDPSVPLKGQSYARFLVGKKLTDQAIERYELAGRYGLKLQQAAKLRQAERLLSGVDVRKRVLKTYDKL